MTSCESLKYRTDLTFKVLAICKPVNKASYSFLFLKKKTNEACKLSLSSPMVKMKRVGRKPAISNPVNKEVEADLPSIQEKNVHPEAKEEFHDSCKNLIIETEPGTEPEGVEAEYAELETTRQASWAEEVEQADFQTSARDIWSKFKTNQVLSPSSKLTYTEPIIVGDQRVAKIDLEEAEVEASYWKNAIVCIVLGSHPHSRCLKNSSRESRIALVSTIGKPIMIDKVTQERIMIKFVRVLVDIEISNDPPKIISYINEKKQLVEQGVEYEWLPLKCSACDKLGHIVENCNKETKVVWKKKPAAEKGAKKVQEMIVRDTGEAAVVTVDKPENVTITQEAPEVGKEIKMREKMMLMMDAGTGLDSLMKRLFRVKHALKVFRRYEVGDVATEYREAKEAYCGSLEEAALNPTDQALQLLVNDKQQLFLTAKERMDLNLRQQSKISWIKFNDENSTYFHASMRKRRLENRITTFMKGDAIIDDFEEVVKHFVKHFENFMGSKSSAVSTIDETCLKQGNVNSVKLVHTTFTKFCNDTGLSANTSKSHIYFGGVCEEVKAKILEIVQIEEGSFPLKYLGVNLRPTKWKAADCGVILDKLNKNLNCWASRNLSFAGRAQLIHSVMLGNRSKLHRASWEKVCLPKNLGRVGFREGKKWNKALLAKHLWALAKKDDCLWVKWINSIYLKDQNIWDWPKKEDVSWYFKKILSLRDYLDETKLRQATRGNKISAKRCYNLFVEDNQAVNAGAIWDKLVVPKHRFIYWQIFNTHLLTRDYLQQIIVIPSNLCPVCDSALETHDHLFFTCTYAIQVFATVNKWMGSIQWPRSIAEMVLGCCNIKQNLTNRITNTVLVAALYFL
uniref:Reverse transcriptase zinc-binding domain-containing protein n=1 Tax=Cannabis sativa TaxID=3483 RepID=A0A803PL09_CANSA